MSKKPKILVLDIETAPLVAHVWQLWDNNVALNQIESDWYVLSWSAKWLDTPDEIYKKGRKPKIMYQDQRKAKDIENDKPLLKNIWELINEADITLTQNGIKFDHKKLNARFLINGFNPPSSHKYIDTLIIAKKHFGFTSNKLEYMTDKLNTRYKKLKHNKFPGHEMWKECMKGNREAWDEMETYNKHDVLALEETYWKLAPWDNSINYNLYTDDETYQCKCGSEEYQRNGYAYTDTAKYQRYVCKKCGTESRSRVNLFSKEKRASLRGKVTR